MGNRNYDDIIHGMLSHGSFYSVFVKGILYEVHFLNMFHMFYSVGAMSLCNYIPQIMLNNHSLIEQAVKRDYIRLN